MRAVLLLLVGLSLLLSLFIMGPTLTKMNEVALKPLMDGKITTSVAVERAQVPLKSFLLDHTREAELELDRKRAHGEACAEESRRLAEEVDHLESAIASLDSDVELALAGMQPGVVDGDGGGGGEPDGQLLVDKSRTFNQELGQWNDAASFVPV